MAAEKVFTGLPKWAQGVLAVGGLALAAIIGFGIYNKVKAMTETRKSRSTLKDVDSEIKDLKREGNIVPTLTDGQLGIIADQLQTAMQESGTDEEQIYRGFRQLQNDADFLLLVKKYGIRDIRSPYSVWHPPFTGTLTAALSDELDDSEMKELNKIFAQKNIKFRF